MRYIDDSELLQIVEAFEAATIERSEWRHTEHTVVGLYYLERFGLESAAIKMRENILNLLSVGFKLDLLKEMPYHETMTLFWLKTLHNLSEARPGKSLKEKVVEAIALFDKDYPLKFYSKEVLFSPEARRAYVGPDLDAIHELGDQIGKKASAPSSNT